MCKGKKGLIVISLGGSVIVPSEIDVNFLTGFKSLIIDYIKEGRVVIVAGGGSTARNYQNAAREVGNLPPEDLDWLGIHATRLNGHLLRTIFRDFAFKKVIKNPMEIPKFKERILIAAGWKPGCSTDYDAVILAKTLGADKIINITNTDYVYDKDPNKFRDAKPVKQLNWKQFRIMFGNEWSPGLSSPFDPVASKEAEELGLSVIVIGSDIDNLRKLLNGEEYVGTVIK